MMLMLAGLSQAPLQCAGEPDQEQRIRETPEQALYRLAQEFKSTGDRSGWQRTLRYLIRRYPNSRFAERARRELDEAQ